MSWDLHTKIGKCPLCSEGHAEIYVEKKHKSYYCGCSNKQCDMHVLSEYDDGYFEFEEHLMPYIISHIVNYNDYPCEKDLVVMHDLAREEAYHRWLDYTSECMEACDYLNKYMPQGF